MNQNFHDGISMNSSMLNEVRYMNLYHRLNNRWNLKDSSLVNCSHQAKISHVTVKFKALNWGCLIEVVRNETAIQDRSRILKSMRTYPGIIIQLIFRIIFSSNSLKLPKFHQISRNFTKWKSIEAYNSRNLGNSSSWKFGKPALLDNGPFSAFKLELCKRS